MTARQTPQWWRDTALVLVARGLVRGWGQRSCWTVSNQLQVLQFPVMLSREMQVTLDNLYEQKTIEIEPGTTVVCLTATGRSELFRNFARVLASG